MIELYSNYADDGLCSRQGDFAAYTGSVRGVREDTEEARKSSCSKEFRHFALSISVCSSFLACAFFALLGIP